MTLAPPVVSLIGKPDCGKTTLLERLIPALSARGYRVGTIKHHVHTFEMDKPGKDTWRHKQAGARVVALSSPTGLGIVRDTDHDSPLEELVARYFYDVDLVITEGYKRLGYPKIEVFRSGVHPEPLAGDESWIAMVSDVDFADRGLPRFGLDDIEGLADFLVNRFIAPAPTAHVALVVDGQPVPLNAFVESFLRQAVLGMVTSLKGCRNPRQLTLSIRNE